jgi:hypothetical protein
VTRQLQIWDAADAADRKAWIDFWERWPGREVFGHPEYVRLNARPQDRALCAAASVNGSSVLYPFLLRPLGDEPYCEASLRDCTDITTPYGYGGPFRCGGTWEADAVRAFWREFNTWAAKSNVVSEVVRLSLFPESLVEYTGDRRVLSKNVVRVLKSDVEMWRDFEHKVRKNVNKARASGVTVTIDEEGDRLEDFLAIYTGTMERRNASEAYYFPREYFERLQQNLKGQFTYFHALVGNVVVSTELVLLSADRIYSFLGGTDCAWYHVRPNDLLKFEIMNWARGVGKKEYVLGGGYTRDDGIFRYKLSFAPDGSVPFYLGSRVLCANTFEHLVQDRRAFEAGRGGPWQPNPDYFPAYRAA